MIKSELLEGFITEHVAKKGMPTEYKLETSIEKAGKDDSMLSDMQDSKLGNAKEVITDIENLIVTRTELTSELFRDIDKIKVDINNFILQHGNVNNVKEQLELKKKQVEIEEVKLQEKINSWRDIAMLKKELRERVVELKDKESRKTMIDHILE